MASTNTEAPSSGLESSQDQQPSQPQTPEQQALDFIKKRLRNNVKKQRVISDAEAKPDFKPTAEQSRKKEIYQAVNKELTTIQAEVFRLLFPKEYAESIKQAAVIESKETSSKKKNKKNKKKAQPSTETAKEGQTKTTPSAEPTTTTASTTTPSTSTTNTTSEAPAKVEQVTPTQEAQPSTTTTAPAAQPTSNENKQEQKPKQKKEWEFQKDIYVAQYKSRFTADQEGKYIAVEKGVLIGPFESIEELRQAQGERRPAAFIARIGHEDDPPVKRPKVGGRGGRGGRGNATNVGERGEQEFTGERVRGGERGRGGDRGRGARGGDRGRGAPNAERGGRPSQRGAREGSVRGADIGGRGRQTSQ